MSIIKASKTFITSMKKVSSDDKSLIKAQDNIELMLKPVMDFKIGNGVLIENVSLTLGTPTYVEHKLNREPIGWFIVRKRAQADIWDTQDINTLKNRTLLLNTSANVVVDLWVF